MPSLRPSQTKTGKDGQQVTILPDEKQQTEFVRQLDLMVNQLKSYPSVAIWVCFYSVVKTCKLILLQVIYNEGWGQITDKQPEFGLTDRVKQLDPTRLVDSVSGWIDHGAGDFSVSIVPRSQESTMWLIKVL